MKSSMHNRKCTTEIAISDVDVCIPLTPLAQIALLYITTSKRPNNDNNNNWWSRK